MGAAEIEQFHRDGVASHVHLPRMKVHVSIFVTVHSRNRTGELNGRLMLDVCCILLCQITQGPIWPVKSPERSSFCLLQNQACLGC